MSVIFSKFHYSFKKMKTVKKKTEIEEEWKRKKMIEREQEKEEELIQEE